MVNGRTYTVDDIDDVNRVVNTQLTCQHWDETDGKIVFLGSHSVYSNLYRCAFNVDNILYNSTEQFIQSEKAKLFDDDISEPKIMQEKNPYAIKKLGSKIKCFSQTKWDSVNKSIALKAVRAKSTFHWECHDS